MILTNRDMAAGKGRRWRNSEEVMPRMARTCRPKLWGEE
jgi:hypothetical protein